MENRKIILYSLFADLLGVLLFIFAIQMHSNVILYSFYLISILLFIVSFLALYKNLKSNNKLIFNTCHVMHIFYYYIIQVYK